MAAALFMVSCGSDDSSEPVKPRKETMGQRTIIAFVNGNNNLSPSLMSDIQEMRNGSANLPDGYDLIAVVSLSGNNPYIAHLKNGQLNKIREYDHFFNLLTPDSIASIGKWIVSEFPSQQYATVISGHGTGSYMAKDTIATDLERKEPYDANTINAIGFEKELKGSPKLWLNVPSFVTALSHLPHQQFVFFDCCCMMTAETVYELRKYTDYVIGAPCEVPTAGAPYATVVADYALPTEQVGASIINHYNNGYNWDNYNCNGICLSVVKTSAIEGVLAATRAALLDIKQKMPAAERTKIDISKCTFYLREDSRNYLYDIRSVMYHMTEKGYLDNTLYNNLLTALDKAVVSKIKPQGNDGKFYRYWYSTVIPFIEFDFTANDYCGLSMTVPRDTYDSATPNMNKSMYDLEWCRQVGWSELGW
jgi:hypothetical protein